MKKIKIIAGWVAFNVVGALLMVSQLSGQYSTQGPGSQGLWTSDTQTALQVYYLDTCGSSASGANVVWNLCYVPANNAAAAKGTLSLCNGGNCAAFPGDILVTNKARSMVANFPHS